MSVVGWLQVCDWVFSGVGWPFVTCVMVFSRVG